eukprot:UN07611
MHTNTEQYFHHEHSDKEQRIITQNNRNNRNNTYLNIYIMIQFI